MEDAIGEEKESLQWDHIQETGQEQRLARMVGQFSLDNAEVSMEADSGSRIFLTSGSRDPHPGVMG